MNKVDLYNEDCLEVMDRMISDGVKVDCVITDPPYKVISGGSKKRHNRPTGILAKNDGKIFKHNNLKEELWFPKVYEVLKDNSHCYIFTNTLNLERYLRLAREAGFKLHNVLVWKKNNCTPSQYYMKNGEYILFLRKGKAKYINNMGNKTIYEFDNVKNKLHETEKPVPLLEMYVLNSSNEGDTILDFTMGSGSLGEACVLNNRNFIGIEIDKDKFDIAKDRIERLRI